MTQFRANYYINHAGHSISGNYKAYLVAIPTTLAAPIYCYWRQDTALLYLVVNGSTAATVSIATNGFSTTNTWHSIGVTYKADASAGFVSIYINGTQVLTFTGNTGTSASGVYFGGSGESSTGWANYAYFDDFYIDSASSEADAIPPSYSFGWSPASAAGTSAAWAATGATPNYECVNDTGAPNDDTDYVSATSAGLIDYYATTNITVPTGYAVNALIPTVWAKKTDTATASQIKCGARLSGSNTTNTAQSMITTYAMVFERHTAKPGGGAWSETDVNNSEMMIESAGTF